MTVYETLNLNQVRMWCEANGFWPACVPGQRDRIRIGGSPFSPEPEELERIEWSEWFEVFELRRFKFVYDPDKVWFDIQSRNVRPD